MMSVIAIPKAIRDVLGDEGSEALVELFDKVSEGKKQNVLEFVGEKFERRLTEEVAKINERITEEMAKLRTEDIAKLDKRITEEGAKLEIRFAQLDAKMETKMSQMEARIIKWMFIFWIGQIGVLTAIFGVIFKK